jgi:hypothetical protein
MFIRGDHATNDARTQFEAAGTFPLAEDELPEVLARRFGVDIAAFRKGWSRLMAGR